MANWDDFLLGLAALGLCVVLATLSGATIAGGAWRRRLDGIAERVAELETENADLRAWIVRERAFFRDKLETLDRIAARTGQDVIDQLRRSARTIEEVRA